MRCEQKWCVPLCGLSLKGLGFPFLFCFGWERVTNGSYALDPERKPHIQDVPQQPCIADVWTFMCKRNRHLKRLP